MEKSHGVGYTLSMKFFARVREIMDRHPTITDGAIALVLTALALLNLRINWELREPEQHLAVAVVLVVLCVAPLTWRRRFPIVVLLLMSILTIIKGILEIPEGFSGNAVLLALLSTAAYGGRWRNWSCGVSFVALMGYMTYHTISVDLSSFEGNQILLRLFSLFWSYFIFGAAWWFGDVIRTRRERQVELAERTAQLEQQREENARRAVLGERVRIARELHDVVAHHVSVMGIQAGAARRVLERQPEKAHEALSLIETSSRQAVDELHRLLGLLRQKSQVDGLMPQPSLRQLNALVNEIREAGLPVEIKIEGEQRQLPPSIDLSAYRIIQEALTNTLKHAGPAEASVTICYTDGAIELEILDNGRSPTPTSARSSNGKGIIGMRERVNLHNGEFDAGEIPGKGFCVRVKLPLTGRIS